jgi:hypothetical protein
MGGPTIVRSDTDGGGHQDHRHPEHPCSVGGQLLFLVKHSNRLRGACRAGSGIDADVYRQHLSHQLMLDMPSTKSALHAVLLLRR